MVIHINIKVINVGRPGAWIADIYQRTFDISPDSLSIFTTDFTYSETVSQGGVIVSYYTALFFIKQYDFS